MSRQGGRQYRLARLPGLALGLGVPVAIGMLVLIADLDVRRDIGLLAAVALVIVLSWIGGIWPGLTATLVLLVMFAGPIGSAQFDPALDDLSLFLFAAAGLLGTGIVESQHRARWRVEAARDRARMSRRAEHEVRAELESIVAAIGDGIIVSTVDGSISLMNRAAIELVGHQASRFADVAQSFQVEGEGPTAQELLRSEGGKAGEFVLADGRRVVVSTFPLEADGGSERRIVVLRDVTEERRRERLRDAFLSLLSHELRTPMTAVYGGATLLQRVGDRLDPETRNELRADVVYEADRLSRLIDDLLVLTRLEGGGEIGREPALLQHLVADVAAHDGRSLKRSSIKVTVEPGLPPVMGDETSIRQVTHNLISNAVKYSPRGAPVEVRVEAVQPGEVGVRVLDRGPGISGSELEVFDLLYRGPATEGTAPGLGIGLFVCRRLVDAMGGRIWTQPRDGGGSEFGFALAVWPVEDEEPDDVGEAGTSEPEAGRDLVVTRPGSGARW